MVAIERLVHAPKLFHCVVRACPDNDAVRPERVGHRRALFKKLRVRADLKRDVCTARGQSLGNHLRDLVRGADRYGGLVDHDLSRAHVGGNTLCYRDDILQICAAIGCRRRTHTDEKIVATLNGVAGIVGKAKRLLGEPCLKQFIQPRFIKRNLPRGYLLDAGRIDIHAGDLMAHLGKHRCLNQTNIAAAENCNPHCVAPNPSASS